MKNIIFYTVILFSMTAFTQTPCVNGMAGQYACDGYDLQSHIPLANFNSTGVNDSWGWTDPADSKEYAIIGLENGTAFVDISDPVNPIYLGKLPSSNPGSPNIWRDIKTYQNYAFVVSEQFNHGMQIFDLTRLRNVTNPPENFTPDAIYDDFGDFDSAHNIIINEDTGYAYLLGISGNIRGSHFVNIQDPLNPVFVGEYGDDGYTHDAQVVTYNGPDPDYTGREILISSSGREEFISIVDVTNKANPQGIATVGYSNPSYTHQGWFTEDQRYFILGDEIDEQDFGFNTRTIVFDLTDLDNPVFDFEYYGTTEATDHNGYVVGNDYYLANYAAGLRVLDISDIANDNLTEKAFFDTYTANNQAGYTGVWNVYPFFESGNIVISDRSGGFFLVKSNQVLSINETLPENSVVVTPNPVSNILNVAMANNVITDITITDISGKLIYSEENFNTNTKNIDFSSFSNGMYFVTINRQLTKKVLKQ